MFWELRCLESKLVDIFSYAIAKHPDNTFNRDIKGGRSVAARFGDSDKSLFKGQVWIDPLSFLHTARQLNMDNYVHTQLSAVCPYSLRGFDTCFRSILRGNNAGGISDLEFATPGHWSIVIGPYPNLYEQLEYWFNNAGMEVSNFVADSEKTYNAFVLQLKNKEKMPLTEFLQKVYMISYFLTKKFDISETKDDRINKLIKMCEHWLENIENRHRIVNVICGYKKDKIAEFESLILNSEDTIPQEEQERRKDHIERLLTKRNFHTQRHDFIRDQIPEDANTFLELGCGGGKLLRFIAKVRRDLDIVGLEIDSRACMKAKPRRMSKRFAVINTDMLWPNLDKDRLTPDFLAMTEVLEHLDKFDRSKVIDLLMNYYIPAKMVITVPNVEFNKYIAALEPGELRHPDHKIEYTKEQVNEEIVVPLSESYDVVVSGLETEEGETPSWIITATHKSPENRKISEGLARKISERYSPIYIPEVNYTIKQKELSAGFSSPAWKVSGKNIFYLGHTISPSDYYDVREQTGSEYLEHPIGAFSYYSDRGIDYLYAEEKQMGSRAYVLVFANQNTAKKSGMNSEIIINSRGGFPFFRGDEYIDFQNQLKTEIQDHLDDGEFVMLDGEITPWTIKARGLILHEFKIPGDCTYLDRKFGMTGDPESAERYLQALEQYSQEKEPVFHAFNVLAKGLISESRYGTPKFVDVTHGMMMHRNWHYRNLVIFNGKAIKSIRWMGVDLMDSDDKHDCIKAWELFCEERGGEGFVFKLPESIQYSKNGFPIQPMMKVRGRDYLRLIYGVDYLESDYFQNLTYRGTKAKRIQAIQQHVIGINMLRAFLNRNWNQQHRFVAGFIGSDSINFRNVDATL